MSKRYSDVVFLGTHNSYASEPRFSKSVINQKYSITEQLEGGVTMLDIKIRKVPGERQAVTVCHGPSILTLFTGEVSLHSVLVQVADFVRLHPLILITIYCNVLGTLLNASWANSVIRETFNKSGLSDFVYSYNTDKPHGFTEWPFVDQMLLENKPVMVFGLKGLQDFKQNDNLFWTGSCNEMSLESALPKCKDDFTQRQVCTTKRAWQASSIEDLSPERYIQRPKNNDLFLMNCFASPRGPKSFPYLFGGNPTISQAVNEESLLKLYHHISLHQKVNWVWIDFWTPQISKLFYNALA